MMSSNLINENKVNSERLSEELLAHDQCLEEVKHNACGDGKLYKLQQLVQRQQQIVRGLQDVQ